MMNKKIFISMKKLLLLGLLFFGLSSCEVYDEYGCYTFEVRYEETYVPYRPIYYTISRYDRCGLTEYDAYREARFNEYQYTWYNPAIGYYITETQTCTYWRSW